MTVVRIAICDGIRRFVPRVPSKGAVDSLRSAAATGAEWGGCRRSEATPRPWA